MVSKWNNTPLNRLIYKKFLPTCLILSTVTTLTGCVTPPGEWNISKESWTNELSLLASGHQQFKCSSDSQGYYWKFIKTEANLYSTLRVVASIFIEDIPPVGKLVAYSGTKQTFTHTDESSVRTTGIIRNTPSFGERNLPNLMLKARSAARGERAFDSVHTILRTNTIGGMPTKPCGASNLGTVHRSEFNATYTFLK